METITIGGIGPSWKLFGSSFYYAQRGESEEFAFGKTTAEALANLEKREAAKLPRFDTDVSEEVAFLALGAAETLRETTHLSCALDRLGGYMGLISEVICHAPLLLHRWKQIGPAGFDGVWLYDVTERFGREWARVLLNDGDEQPAELLDQIILGESKRWTQRPRGHR